jgi:hypothetical protein
MLALQAWLPRSGGWSGGEQGMEFGQVATSAHLPSVPDSTRKAAAMRSQASAVGCQSSSQERDMATMTAVIHRTYHLLPGLTVWFCK